MQLIFDSVDEVKNFVKEHLKGTRRGKGEADDENPAPQAPAPIQPPATAMPSFAAPSQGFPVTESGGAKPGFPSAAPEIVALVTRINAKIDSAIAGGQPADAVLGWFRQRCGTEAAAATLEQIKGHFLPKLSIAQLEETAKLMGA